MNEEFAYQDKKDEEEARRIAALIVGYIKQTLNPEEHDELDAWVEGSDSNMRLFEELTDEKNLEENLRKLEAFKTGEAYDRVSSEIRQKKKNPFSRKWQFTVAASLIVFAAIAVVVFYFTRSDFKQRQKVTEVKAAEIGPGGKRAILVMNNGKRVQLNGNSDSTFHEFNSVILTKQKDVLSYEPMKVGDSAIIYNTLLTPRGGEFQLVLADGTKVWLNAESSLRYPVAFIGNERRVELKGEAYFEVAASPVRVGERVGKRPFVISVNGKEVEVLGTHFNINGYADNEVNKISLLEGRIRIRGEGSQGVVLDRGQEAEISPAGRVSIISSGDVEGAIAWKKGVFHFKDATIDEVMKEMSRWYDVEFEFRTKPTHHFNADIPRDVPVSKLIHFLELTNRVHFKVEGKKIIVDG